MVSGKRRKTRKSPSKIEEVVVHKYEEFARNFNAALDAAGYPDLHYGRQVAIGRDFGISTSAARKWVMGDCLPDHENLIMIADRLNVGLDALFGRTPRISQEPMVSIPFGGVIAPCNDANAADAVEWIEKLSTVQMEASWLESWMRLKHNDLFLMKVEGSNMSPTLAGGDIVFVDSSPIKDVLDIEDNGIYLIMAKGKPQLRRILLGFDEVVTLVSDNKHFPPISVPLTAFQPGSKAAKPVLTILGKVPWCVHRVSRASFTRTAKAVGSGE